MTSIRFNILVVMLMALIWMGFGITPVFSQENAKTDSLKPDFELGGRGFLAIGPQTINLSNFNKLLRRHGYPEFSEKVLSVGGGGNLFANNVLIGTEGYYLLVPDNEAQINNMYYRTSMYAVYFQVNGGYKVYERGGFSFYPLAGLGGGGIFSKISRREVMSFEDMLADPANNSSMSNYNLLVDLGIGMDYLKVIERVEKGEGGFCIGIRAGYTFCPYDFGWKMDDLRLYGAPRTTLTGPYVRIIIGGGGKGNVKLFRSGHFSNRVPAVRNIVGGLAK